MVSSLDSGAILLLTANDSMRVNHCQYNVYSPVSDSFFVFFQNQNDKNNEKVSNKTNHADNENEGCHDYPCSVFNWKAEKVLKLIHQSKILKINWNKQFV